ncbi:uncharacterized protein M421DRAFT_414936 [Didymella exigua CBS 183.55]|uniref:Uncharacterized protein n=1 Tax=Didymella exigua CBS 183.55 TaxID=1150837 RepID=A0A6A5S8Q1_9PLEO|nr:uncharacterized protein M421DRAFT_414936 [Didymella exigua CBS 183.55]KAF1933887.1 hypothetical protein M421DRAFT_414936 [Didymella exigua CBS 183.55]
MLTCTGLQGVNSISETEQVPLVSYSWLLTTHARVRHGRRTGPRLESCISTRACVANVGFPRRNRFGGSSTGTDHSIGANRLVCKPFSVYGRWRLASDHESWKSRRLFYKALQLANSSNATPHPFVGRNGSEHTTIRTTLCRCLSRQPPKVEQGFSISVACS